MNDPQADQVRAAIESRRRRQREPAVPPQWPVPLTAKQQRVYDQIVAVLLTTGHQPSLGELASALGFSGRNASLCHIRALAKKGWIARSTFPARCLELRYCPDGSPFLGLAFIKEKSC